MRVAVIAFSILLASLNSGSAFAEDINVLQLSRDSAVKLVSQSGNSSGSGFFIDGQHVLTCFHVVAALSVNGSSIDWHIYPDLQAVLPSGETISASVVSVPTQTSSEPLVRDFAVVKLKNKPLKAAAAIQLASDQEIPKVGDDVVFSGYPLATPGMVTHRGMVSGFDDSKSMIFVQASINKGNSGGALINGQGHVIGLISMREGNISKGLAELKVYIDNAESHGSVHIMGVDTLQATKAIIQTLDRYISTGIGYARSIKFAREYLDKHKELLNN